MKTFRKAIYSYIRVYSCTQGTGCVLKLTPVMMWWCSSTLQLGCAEPAGSQPRGRQQVHPPQPRRRLCRARAARGGDPATTPTPTPPCRRPGRTSYLPYQMPKPAICNLRPPRRETLYRYTLYRYTKTHDTHHDVLD